MKGVFLAGPALIDGVLEFPDPDGYLVTDAAAEALAAQGVLAAKPVEVDDEGEGSPPPRTARGKRSGTNPFL